MLGIYEDRVGPKTETARQGEEGKNMKVLWQIARYFWWYVLERPAQIKRAKQEAEQKEYAAASKRAREEARARAAEELRLSVIERYVTSGKLMVGTDFGEVKHNDD